MTTRYAQTMVIANLTRVQGMFKAKLFNLLTKQAEADLLYSMVRHDLERHYGHDPSDLMYTSWESSQALHYFETCLTQNMQSSMT